MATASLTTTPTQLDDGTAGSLSITNTGATDVVVLRAGSIVVRLRPTQPGTVFPEGSVVTAATTAGTGTLTYTTIAVAAPATVPIPDATSSVTGGVRLTNHLGGTATAPTVPGLAGKAGLTGGNTWTGAQDFTGATVTGIAGVTFTGCKATSTAATSLATSTVVLLPLATEEWDTTAFHDLVTNNSRVTIPTGLGGKYAVSAGIGITGNATGRRTVRVLKNGTNVVLRGEGTPAHGNAMNVGCAGTLDMTAGDYLEIQGFQDSGSTLTLTTGLFTDSAGGVQSAYLSVHRLG